MIGQDALFFLYIFGWVSPVGFLSALQVVASWQSLRSSPLSIVVCFGI